MWQDCMRAQLLQSFMTLCDPMDCSPPGSSIHGILQPGKMEWVAMPSSNRSSQPRDRTGVSCDPCIAGRLFTHWAPGLGGMQCDPKCNVTLRASRVAQMVKNPPVMWEIWVQSLGQEDPLEKEMTTHSSSLAWGIPWTEETGGLRSIGVAKSQTQLSDHHFHFQCDTKLGVIY